MISVLTSNSIHISKKCKHLKLKKYSHALLLYCKMSSENKPLVFNITKECKITKARVSKMILHHGEVDTPVFMPVGTQVQWNIIEIHQR